jgi:ABC-type uncharacterized transport system permease subunit
MVARSNRAGRATSPAAVEGLGCGVGLAPRGALRGSRWTGERRGRGGKAIPAFKPAPFRLPKSAFRAGQFRLPNCPFPPTFRAVLALTDRHLFALAVLLYGLGAGFALLVWRREFRQDQRALYLLLGAGFVLHTAAMFRRGFSLERCPIHNLFEASMFLLWTTAAAYLVLGAFHRLRFLGALVAPLLLVVGVFALMPQLDRQGPRPGFIPTWEPLHAAFILLAYGAFGLGSLAAVTYLVQEHNLKVHKARALTALLPSISRLESVTAGLLAAGLLFLTGGIGTGLLYLKAARGSYVTADPFVIYSLLTWLVYLGLLVARWRFAQRGRRLAYGAVASFTFVLLTFWGIYLLSGLHNRAPQAVTVTPAAPGPVASAR